MKSLNKVVKSRLQPRHNHNFAVVIRRKFRRWLSNFTLFNTMVQLSEETKVPHGMKGHSNGKERIGRVIDMGKVAVHYGWIPMILYIGIVVYREGS